MTYSHVQRVLTLVILGWVLSMGGCSSTGGGPAAGPAAARDGVFVHITSGPAHAHRVLMGLRMAQMMASERDVLVYLDVDGIKVVLDDAPELAMEPFGSSRAMVSDLLGRGVGVYACPGCLKALGKTPAQLMPGVKVAEKQAFFGFTRGRILTLDY